MENLKSRPTRRLLLVEDNHGDVRLVREALMESELSIKLEVASDGQQALEVLGLTPESPGAEIPELIVMDLKLPVIDGKELLRSIKNHPRTRSIPVVVFSSSSLGRDIDGSYREHANCYVTKPGTLTEFIEAIQEILTFWFSRVQLPNSNPASQ